MSALRLLGLLATLLAVGVLAGSLLLGLGSADVAPPAASREEALPAPGRRVRVEVLNAAGVEGLARLATDSLRRLGFDVVYYGNAPSFGRDSSLVLHRAGDRRGVERVGRAIGIPRVVSDPDTSLYLDATVVLGTEWAEALSAAPPDSAR